MRWLRRIVYQCRSLFQHGRMDAELDDEMRAYLEASIDDKMRAGLTRESAQRMARLEFGSPIVVREQVHDAGWESFVWGIWQDVRYACRSFARTPGFTVAAVATMALGIGATTAVFSIVDGTMLRALPYPEPDRLVWVWGQRSGGSQRSAVNPLEYLDYREQSRTFAQLAASVNFQQTATLVGHGDPAPLRLGVVSGNFFDTLGVGAALGRALTIDDEQPDRNDAAVLSHGLWRRLFNADPSIVGSPVTIDDRRVVVVGVMPEHFRPLQTADLWMPMRFHEPALNRRPHFMRPIGRLRSGVTLAQAQADMQVIASRLERQYPATSTGWTLRLVPLDEQLTTGRSRASWLLAGAVAFLLLMGCANVAALLLARSTSRSKEIAVRFALGAGRQRIVRQLLTESGLLAVVAAALGIALGYWTLEGLLALDGFNNLPAWTRVSLDARALAFAIPLTMLTALLFGVMPAVESTRPDLVEALGGGGRAVSPGVRPRRLRSILVTAEVAAAVILLVGAGLFLRSLMNLRQVDPGFNADRVLTFPIDLPLSRYRQPEQVAAFHRELQRQLTAIPGLERAGVVSQLPLGGQMNDVPFTIEGRGGRDDDRTTVDQRFVDDGYFDVMSIPLARGRHFSPEDARQSSPVTVISQRMAQRFFPDEDPVGHRLRMLGGTFEIVGIVGDVRHRSLATDVYATVYVPRLNVPNGAIVVRASDPQTRVAGAVATAVRGIDRDLPLPAVQPLEQVLDASVALPRSNALLLNAFAALALVLALTGIYGLVSYTVTDRRQEIGIRMALGATRRDIERLVVGIGVKLAVVGASVGLVGAIGVSRLIAGLLFGVRPTDPATYAAIAAVMIATVLVACWLPARRASSIDPVAATRTE